MLITSKNAETIDLRNPQVPQAIVNSGSNPKLLRAALAVMMGHEVDPSLCNSRKHEWVDSRQLYLAGALQNAGKLTFFNGSSVEHAGNWPQDAGLSQNEVFVCTGFGAEVGFGVLPTSAGVAGDHDVATQPADITASANMRLNAHDFISKRCKVNLTFANREIIKDMYGLDSFPWGGGLAGWGSSAATTASQSCASNGIAAKENGWFFSPYEFLDYGERVRALIEYQAAASLSVTAADIFIKVKLRGWRIVTTA